MFGWEDTAKFMAMSLSIVGMLSIANNPVNEPFSHES